ASRAPSCPRLAAHPTSASTRTTSCAPPPATTTLGSRRYARPASCSERRRRVQSAVTLGSFADITPTRVVLSRASVGPVRPKNGRTGPQKACEGLGRSRDARRQANERRRRRCHTPSVRCLQLPRPTRRGASPPHLAGKSGGVC